MKRSLRITALLFLVLAFAAWAKGGAATSAPAPVDEQGALAIARARLASSGRFYLELDLSAARLHLCHSGVSIATYPLRDLSVGRPRIFLVPRGKERHWVGEVWSSGELEPARQIRRVKIVPGDESTVPTPGEAGVIPPSMDELIAVPRVFEIRFQGNKVIQLRLAGDIPGSLMATPKWGGRWRDFLAALGLAPADALRLRATVAAKDGAALFRSFPEAPPEMLVRP